jgi:general secretion pathway protein K
VAIIMALLLTTLAITIVASLFWQQQVQVRAIENQRLQLQKQWILRGALDWASLILRDDARYSSVDTLDEPWAAPLAETHLDQYVENGRADSDAANTTLSGSISDAQARLNLNNLRSNNTIDPAAVSTFARLLTLLNLDPALAQATADQMTPGDHSEQGIGYIQVDDLLTVPGLTPALLEKIKPYVIFLPGSTPVNVNTAPVQVIAAIFELPLADASTLIEKRKTAAFRDLADVSNHLPNQTFNVANLSVNSSYFLVNGKVRMNRARLDMQALLQRNGAATQLQWIREF